MVSRRQLLCAVSGAGAGAVLAGCGGVSATGLPASALKADVHILNQLIRAEYYAVGAYVAGIPLLSGTDVVIAQQFLNQDMSHIEDLAEIVRKAGVKPYATDQVYNLGHPRDRSETLALLHHAEQATLRTYLDAIPRLSQGVVKATAASLFANDAQHASTIRGRLGLAPVAEAIVTGNA
jgi:ferritin-like protein